MRNPPIELSESEFICTKCGSIATSSQPCPHDGQQMISYDEWISRRNNKSEIGAKRLSWFFLFVITIFAAYYLYDVFVLGKGYAPPSMPFGIRGR